MYYALDCIWDTLDFGENQEVSQIKIKLRDFIISFGESHASRKTEFIKIAHYIPAHRHKDTQVYEMIKVKKLKDILHDEDEKILFDLHEYNKNHQELNLVFVSWDKSFIKAIESLLEVLSFNEYINLE